jgi:hypothetical protein
MPKVHCDITSCEYCKKDGVTDFICGCDEIELIDEQCITFGAHVDMSPEYRDSFWKRLRSREDQHECKQESVRGKRYEMIGLVWFTDNDDRWGTDELWFTEQRSGLRCQGKDITEERADTIRERINSVCPVTDLPEAALEDL